MKESKQWKEYSHFYVVPRAKDGKLINGSYNRIWKKTSYCGTLNTTMPIQVGEIKNDILYYQKLKIKECFKLMGISQIAKIQYKKIIPISKLYLLAGNSICINVLEYIFENKMDLPREREIKIFEAFAGYGSQNLALKNLGYKTQATISEWFSEALIAYGLLHHYEEFVKLDNDTFNNKDNINYLQYFDNSKKTYSINSKTANNLKHFKNKRYLWIAEQVINNVGSIVGLSYKDTPVEFDLVTWSFPCQDISNAGKNAGMTSNDTRSGLCWEFIKWLKSMVYVYKKPPRYLLMENVPAIHNKRNMADFQRLIDELKEIGYENEWFDLNAKDTISHSFPNAIAQNRKRTFLLSKWAFKNTF